MDEKALGRRLQLARKRAGLTQQELCQKANLSYSTLAKIERGAIKAPSVFTVASIAQVTGTTIEDLLDLAAMQSNMAPALPAKKRSKTGVRFVYFDVNGTLVRYYQRAFTEAANELQIPSDKVEIVFWRYNEQACNGQMTVEEFNQAIARDLELPEFDWHKYYMNNVEAVPGVEELVAWTAENYEIGIFSNSIPGVLDELLANGVIPKADYKVIVDSSKVGAAKPSDKIYQIGQELAAMEAKEILLIDDTRPYLTAADHHGWQVTWFDDLHPEDSIARVKSALEF